MGRKLKQRYFRGEGYVETDIHIGSSAIANNITGLCRGYAKAMVVDLAFCLEGRAEEELPERLIGVARYRHPDVEKYEDLYDEETPPPVAGGGGEPKKDV
eukprot:CAMPEP_0182543050 /NCGR_PEP_ID=MMETSP1323-20130603/31070_1 /TAXON_ID=236787 /ORGANISM="Florenciella parvula, Strain RCC1693" /LENGTH=99 /DNA_ID=CAMNT_0024753951 /DNA_START=48 /DNA_END=347 /DNA_ORIENTATION=-